jgi:hypothetical protein
VARVRRMPELTMIRMRPPREWVRFFNMDFFSGCGGDGQEAIYTNRAMMGRG